MRIGNNKYNSVATLQENNILFSINQNGTNAYEISIHYVDEKGYSRNLLHRISGTFRTLFNKIRATDYCHLYLIEDKAYILVLINDFYIKTADMLGQSISKVPYDSVGNTFKLIELENKPSFYYYVPLAI